MYDYIPIKILLLGDIGAGKSSLCYLLTDKKQDCTYTPTLGIDYYTRIIFKNNVKYRFHIWDTTGQEKYKHLISCYFKISTIIILVFNMNDKNAYDSIVNWYNFITHDGNTTPIFLIGNMCDLPINADIEKIKTFVVCHNLMYIEISIKNNINCANITDIILGIKQPLVYTNLNASTNKMCCNIC